MHNLFQRAFSKHELSLFPRNVRENIYFLFFQITIGSNHPLFTRHQNNRLIGNSKADSTFDKSRLDPILLFIRINIKTSTQCFYLRLSGDHDKRMFFIFCYLKISLSCQKYFPFSTCKSHRIT